MKKLLFLAICVAAMNFAASAQDTKIRFFGQPEFGTQTTRQTNQFVGVSPTGQYITKDTTISKTSFNPGTFALFVTSQISERISVLSEISFSNSGKTSTFELQRLAARYEITNYFSVRAGKMFTPIGYWNNQYTLGLVLQPTISRPAALRTVSDGGVLQYKDTGVQFEGSNITRAGIFYKVMVGNGVGYYGSNDKNDHHVGVTSQVGFEPLEGLKISGSAQMDRIEKGKSNPNGTISSLPDNGNYTLLVGSVAYMNPEKKTEVIAEFLHQTNAFDNIGKRTSYSGYVYAGYRVTDKITPYFLYNYTQAGASSSESDPYFAPIPVNINRLTLGARYKFNSSFIVKMEYETNVTNTYYQPITAGTVTLDQGFTNISRIGSLRTQLAFVF
jgi:opacity protein-like surface antigen